MYALPALAVKYLKYYFTAANGKGHGVHSPFVFEFIERVLNDKRPFYAYQSIERLRLQMMNDQTVLQIEDFGAGSVTTSSNQRKVSSIARSALKPVKYGQLMMRMVNYYGLETMVELGTSLGITSAYLASGNIKGHLYTMEGASAVANFARNNFAQLKLNNITLVQGNFDNTLPGLLQQLPVVDFAFVDGNHRKEPTLGYFRQLLQKRNDESIFIFDDIHWSSDMEEAWAAIQQHPDVTLTIDLFFIGIVFFRKEQKAPQHFSIRF